MVRQSKGKKQQAEPPCSHTNIQVDPSFHALEAGYTWPSASQRGKAQGVGFGSPLSDQLTFPAPLIFPGDDLALDPQYTGQSFSSWTRLMKKRPITAKKRTIYVVEPPSFASDVKFTQSWTRLSTDSSETGSVEQIPSAKDVADYVRAFYHPLPVKILPSSHYKFVSWSSKDTASLKAINASKALTDRPLIGLQTPSEFIGIRTRPTPLKDFPFQLNLNDLLDAAISTLPKDAYAMLMLVNHDLYEDEDDEFVCGRAYGGNGVAVVSTARYHPGLDPAIELDIDHVWPMSHCSRFTRSFRSNSRKRRISDSNTKEFVSSIEMMDSPMQAAVAATINFRDSIEETLHARWLARVCRTAAHEIGHCFGVDHCIYYACCMQGSATINEDPRQPPYLCPVDLAKVLGMTVSSEEDHLRAMLTFCGRNSDSELFVAYGAWIAARLKQLGCGGQPK